MSMIREQLAQAITFHQAGKLTQAARLYQAELNRDRASHIALDGLGVVRLQLDQAEQSIALIRKAIDLQPLEPQYHYHLAEAYVASSKLNASIKAYKKALKLSPDSGDYHFALGNAFRDSGHTEEAIKSFKAAIRYAANDFEAHNNLANILADKQQFEQAVSLLNKALVLNPDYAEAYLNLARIKYETGDQLAAIGLCKRATILKPGLLSAHLNLGEYLYSNPQQLPMALDSFQNALQIDPHSIIAKRGMANTLLKLDQPVAALPLFRDIFAAEVSASSCLGLSNNLIRLQQFSEAEEMASKAIELRPGQAEAYLNLGICLQTRGAFKRAVKAHHKALTLNPDLTDAAYHLALLDAGAASSSGFRSSVQRMQDNQLSPEKLVHLHFALAKLAEKNAEFDNAFSHFHKANQIKAELYPFDSQRHNIYVERIINTFSAKFFQQRNKFGLRTQAPVFIIGMPRSGSTLLEQILNAHPRINGIGEHREMREIMQQVPAISASSQAVPECVSELSESQCKKLGERYLASLPKGLEKYVRFTDKMLGNFLRLGLIALLFPRARIIHCRRKPLDACLSCYTQDFSSGLRFTTDLGMLGHAHNSYLKLMSHWEDVLPMHMMSIHYEDLVSDPETSTRGLLDFCDLPWDDACLAHHTNKARVSTASFQQVRQPIYLQSIDKWKCYETHLTPLIEALDGVDTRL